jgi:hypothetical protein
MIVAAGACRRNCEQSGRKEFCPVVNNLERVIVSKKARQPKLPRFWRSEQELELKPNSNFDLPG